jgi:hypothetical protein
MPPSKQRRNQVSCQRSLYKALAVSAIAAESLSAQAGEVDRGVLTLMRGSEIIGREEFVVRRGRGSGALAGFTVISTAWYPADRPQRSLSAVVEISPDSIPLATRLEAGNGDRKRVLIGLGPRRIAVRTATATGESAREFPARAPQALVDDSLFALHAFPPVTAQGTARTLSLEGGRGPVAQITDHGTEPTSWDGAPTQLRHLSIVSPEVERHLWYDEAGRIMKVVDSRSGWVAVRSQDGGE